MEQSKLVIRLRSAAKLLGGVASTRHLWKQFDRLLGACQANADRTAELTDFLACQGRALTMFVEEALPARAFPDLWDDVFERNISANPMDWLMSGPSLVWRDESTQIEDPTFTGKFPLAFRLIETVFAQMDLLEEATEDRKRSPTSAHNTHTLSPRQRELLKTPGLLGLQNFKLPDVIDFLNSHHVATRHDGEWSKDALRDHWKAWKAAGLLITEGRGGGAVTNWVKGIKGRVKALDVDGGATG